MEILQNLNKWRLTNRARLWLALVFGLIGGGIQLARAVIPQDSAQLDAAWNIYYTSCLGVILLSWFWSADEPQRPRRGFCPKCALRLNNVPPGDPCPSCGTPTSVFPSKPLGRPVCARCHRDMRGREEGRTCPDCGAMYGIEYVEETLAPAR